MTKTVKLELSPEKFHELMDALRISKSNEVFPEADTDQRILQARQILGFSTDESWKFHDWTKEDQAAKQRKEWQSQQDLTNWMQKNPV